MGSIHHLKNGEVTNELNGLLGAEQFPPPGVIPAKAGTQDKQRMSKGHAAFYLSLKKRIFIEKSFCCHIFLGPRFREDDASGMVPRKRPLKLLGNISWD